MSEPLTPVQVPGKSRAVWMDLIRGSAILLVIVLHATVVPWLSGIKTPPFVGDVNEFFGPYRMSLLFMLSGALLPRALKKPLKTYYWGKIRMIAWPYVLWLVLVQYTDDIMDWADMSFLLPTSWLWFLFYLFAFYAVAPLLALIPGLWFAVVPVALWVASPLVEDPLFSQMLYYGGFFFVGHLACTQGKLLIRFENRATMYSFLAVAAAASFVYVSDDGIFREILPDGFIEYRSEFVPITLLGVAGIVMAARRWTGDNPGSNHYGRNPARWLQYIGRNSIVFYVVHFPVIVSVSLWLQDENVTDPWAYFWACSLFSVAVSLAVCWLREFKLVDAFFVLPTWSRQKRASTA